MTFVGFVQMVSRSFACPHSGINYNAFPFQLEVSKMLDSKSSLDKVVSALKQQRDELRLQIHLASMEAKDEYERLSGKYDELSDQYEPVRSALEETAGNLLSALSLAAGELELGFQRVRKALTESK